MPEIILGAPSQVQAVKSANALRAILCDDPRFAFQGGIVSVAHEQKNAAKLAIGLSGLQGYASCHFVQKPNAQGFSDAYQAAGLNPQIWQQVWGRDSAMAQSHAFLQDDQIPQGLTLKAVTNTTSDQTILRICEMSLQAGVLPVPVSVMRGEGPRGLFSYVEAGDGQIVATGGACMAYHADSPKADEAFWGMLATHKAWRGKRLACWVGAQVIEDMAEKFGARGFSSGVKPDNPSSKAMCSRWGVGPSDFVYVGAVDPAAFGDTPITR